MRVHSLCQCIFLLSLLLSILSLSWAEEKTFEVVGIGECADCKENNIKTTQAFTGVGVTIDCKLKNGETKRIGAGNLDKEGKFKVSIPNGELLEEECYAQLHSDAIGPCPAHNGLEASKIMFKAHTNGLHTFGPSKNLQLSTALLLCSSKFLWPHFKYPPLSKIHSWKKKFPLYKPKPKLSPPPLPLYKPKPKPKPKPEPPVYKPKPKPKSPVYKPPKKSIYKKPLPPIYKNPEPEPLPPPIPPFYKKKPCPPLPKYFKHPKFGYFPPLPPSIPLP
ncbi:hypothetical protein ACJIZ3_000803 [Penstemon smallii]|uniref:Proline-rich protein n=1 Tax=Penstemon smallii TaxID=265156 RepID=A0ABD3U4N7_9LAMI